MVHYSSRQAPATTPHPRPWNPQTETTQPKSDTRSDTYSVLARAMRECSREPHSLVASLPLAACAPTHRVTGEARQRDRGPSRQGRRGTAGGGSSATVGTGAEAKPKTHTQDAETAAQVPAAKVCRMRASAVGALRLDRSRVASQGDSEGRGGRACVALAHYVFCGSMTHGGLPLGRLLKGGLKIMRKAS